MANRVTFRVTGGQAAAKNAKKFANVTAPNAVAQGVYLEGNNIMTASKRRTPVDIGALKGSGYVTLPEMHGSRILVEAGYGGPAADYAVVQHEKTELRHEVGEAKFLEKSVDERAPRLASNITAIARRAIARGNPRQPSKAPGMPTDPWEGGE